MTVTFPMEGDIGNKKEYYIDALLLKDAKDYKKYVFPTHPPTHPPIKSSTSFESQRNGPSFYHPPTHPPTHPPPPTASSSKTP